MPLASRKKTDEDIQEALRLYDRLVQRRAPYEGMWQAIAALMRPTRVDIRQRRIPGAAQTQMIFDGTAVKAAHDLASALSGSMTPVEYPWFSLRMRSQELNEDFNVRLWLEECTRRIHLAFQQSNFAGEMHELYLDLIIFGTGCLWIEERPLRTPYFNGFLFRTISPGRYVILEGPDGLVNTVCRTFRLSAAACVDLWGRDGVSEKTRAYVEQKKGETMVEILHIVRPLGEGTLTDRRPYESSYYEREHRHHLATKTLRRLYFMVPRWTKVSDEEYGRGQGHIAYPDVASLNRAIEMRFKQWALAIDPPLVTVDDGVIGKIKRAPGTRITVRSRDAIGELESKARFDVAQFSENDLRAAIRNYFFADQLHLPAKQYMTAYEIQAQVEIMQRLLGPTIGRVKSELLAPLLDNAFDLMLHAGALPPPPPLLLEAAAQGLADIDVEYESPLARSQRANDLVALDRAITVARPFLELRPETVDNFDADKVVRYVAEQAGVPLSLLRNRQDVAVLRRDRLAQAQAREEQVQTLAGAEALQKGGTGLAKVMQTLAAQGGGEAEETPVPPGVMAHGGQE